MPPAGGATGTLLLPEQPAEKKNERRQVLAERHGARGQLEGSVFKDELRGWISGLYWGIVYTNADVCK